MDLGSLVTTNDSKILFVVLDGLGGVADGQYPRTELEDASTPHLDRLAAEGVTGLLEPVGPGITPGSGPGHLALFGYDPVEYELGRGALSAAGLGFDLLPGDVAARGNLCTLDEDGRVVDRRAGRLPDDQAQQVVERLQREVEVAGVEVFFRHERQHRLLVVVRGAGLDPRVTDTDPQDAGVPPAEPRAVDPAAELMAEVVRRLTEEATRVLSDETRANGLLLRGFDSQRKLPSFAERYRLSAAALAVYPMYRGIAHLLGMRVLGRPPDLQGELKLLREHWEGADFFFLHHKDADSAGEDGNRPAKVAAIERLDEAVPDLVALEPDVLVVTGDHATPSQLAAHSWHPVPVLLWGRRCGRDRAEGFGEGWCLHGGLGRHPTKDLMAVVLANAGRLAKYGA